MTRSGQFGTTARVRRSPSSEKRVEARSKRAPKKMHRALLTRETAAKSPQHTFRAGDNLPATMGRNGIVERVFVVLHERYGDLHLDRRGDDRRFDRQCAKQRI